MHSVSITVLVCVAVCVCVNHSVSLCICLCYSVCDSMCVCMYTGVCVCVCVSLCACYHVCHCVCVILLYVCVCVHSVCMSLYVTMFVWVTVHHNVCVCVATLPSVTMAHGPRPAAAAQQGHPAPAWILSDVLTGNRPSSSSYRRAQLINIHFYLGAKSWGCAPAQPNGYLGPTLLFFRRDWGPEIEDLTQTAQTGPLPVFGCLCQ